MIKPKKPKKGRSFAEVCPKIAKEWHPTLNGELTPFDVNAGSAFMALWKCPKGDDHVWPSTVKNRKYGNGCGVCNNKVVVNSNCLATNYPNLVKEWHPIKNKPLTPKTVAAYSNRKVWWRCKSGDEFPATVAHRTLEKTGCPYCTNQKVRDNGDNSHAAIYPESALEWDYKKNYPIKPQEITPAARKRYWWKCQSCNNSYQQAPYQRTNGPKCGKCGIESTKRKLQQGDKYIMSAKEICEKEGYLFESVVGQYKNVDSKFRYICKNGHKKEVTFHGFVLSNTRCPECAEYGFNLGKEAFFYIREIKIKNKRAIKFGITNQMTGARESKQKRGLYGDLRRSLKFKHLVI